VGNPATGSGIGGCRDALSGLRVCAGSVPLTDATRSVRLIMRRPVRGLLIGVVGRSVHSRIDLTGVQARVVNRPRGSSVDQSAERPTLRSSSPILGCAARAGSCGGGPANPQRAAATASSSRRTRRVRTIWCSRRLPTDARASGKVTATGAVDTGAGQLARAARETRRGRPGKTSKSSTFSQWDPTFDLGLQVVTSIVDPPWVSVDPTFLESLHRTTPCEDPPFYLALRFRSGFAPFVFIRAHVR
jgi:hypothetical protein